MDTLQFGSGNPVLEGFTNSDMMAIDTSRSTSGYMMTYVRGVVLWQSKLQNVVALSATEVEYIVAVELGKEIVWMKNFISELGIRQEEF